MKLSIVVPIYFYNHFVENMLYSLLKQNIHFELIVVGNNMSESEFSNIRNNINQILSEKPIQIIYIYTSKKGANNARMEGYQKSTGEYVFFLDSDDQLANKDVLLDAIQILNKEIPDILSVNLQHALIDEKLNIYPQNIIYDYVKPNQLLTYNDFPEIVTRNYGTNICARFIKRELLEGIHFLDLPYTQDWNVSSKVFSRAKTFYFTSKPSYYWVFRENSISKRKSMTLKTHLDSFNSIIDIVSFYNKEGIRERYKYFINDRIIKYCFSYLGKSTLFDINEGFERSRRFIKEEVIFDRSFFKNKRIVILYMFIMIKPLYRFYLSKKSRLSGGLK